MRASHDEFYSYATAALSGIIRCTIGRIIKALLSGIEALIRIWALFINEHIQKGSA